MRTSGIGAIALGALVFAGLVPAAPAEAQIAKPPVLVHWGDFGEPESQILGYGVDIRVMRGAGFWVLERTQHKIEPPVVEPHKRFDVMTWADGRSCPAIKDQMAKLQDVGWPRFDLPAEPVPGAKPPPISILADGSTAYIDVPVVYGTLEAPSPGGSYVRLKNYGRGPVLDWVSATIRAVGSCWSKTKPES